MPGPLMNETAAAPRRIRFGELSLDLSSGEIVRDGVRVRLQDHAFRVLELLTAHPGEVVSRERLIAHVWPRTTYIDTDAGLNTAVKRLRAALGDDADAPRYFETVPRRGYRFIAPVIPLADDPPGPERKVQGDVAPPARLAAVPRPWRRRAMLGMASLLVAALIGTLGYWLVAVRGPAPDTHVGPAAKLPERTVAVLPFLNLTGDPRREYLALGIADTLLHRLADVREIHVIARTSSFEFQGRNQDVRDIGRRLNARYLVEGSVQESAARLRITAQLIDAASGAHIWSRSFDRQPDDIFAVQDEITLEVARALQLSVTALDNRSLRPIGTAQFDAWLAYEQGRALMTARRTRDLHAAVTALERAVRLDPQFAAAYAALANALLIEADFASPPGTSAPQASHDARLRAAPLIRSALALDATNGDALVARAHMARIEDNPVAAEADYRRAIRSNPNLAQGYLGLGELLIDHFGKLNEGRTMIARARLLDPLEPRGPYYAGLVELFRDRPAAGERLMVETLRIRPDYAPALVRLGWSNWRRDARFADAIKYGEQALRLDPDSIWAKDMLLPWYLELGEADAAEAMLGTRAPLRELAILLHFYRREYGRAGELVYTRPATAGPGDIDAFVLLEHAMANDETARALRVLEQRVAVGDGRDEDAVIVRARLLAAAGDALRARRMLEESLARLDEGARQVRVFGGFARAARARVLADLGRRADAMAELRRVTHEAHDWTYGWYIFERDPFFLPLRTDPGFEALRKAYLARVAAARSRLETWRAEGVLSQPAPPPP